MCVRLYAHLCILVNILCIVDAVDAGLHGVIFRRRHVRYAADDNFPSKTSTAPFIKRPSRADCGAASQAAYTCALECLCMFR